MKYKKFDNTYVVRIEKGEEVISKLTDLCNNENIKLGSIAGIGATDKLVIGLFDTNSKQYHKTTLTGPMEITSLMGNVSTKDGETYLHIHINVCNADMQVYGGHLNECYISATCELHITKIDGEVDRYFDESIGLNLYKL
jgi:predicted DNA-binding protein with PD1-like motif